MTVDNFVKLIEYACASKHIAYTDIKNTFSDFPIQFMDSIEKGIDEKVVEIRFNEYKTTLSAIFDKNNVCNSVILFPDQIENVDKVIIYLTDTFDYDFLKSSWILSNCYLKIKEEKEGIIFVFNY